MLRKRINIRIGPISQLWDTTTLYCECCHTTWKFVVPHTTQYSVHSSCQALCEKCWNEYIPVDRLKFYLKMWTKQRSTHSSGDNSFEWSLISESVLRGN